MIKFNVLENNETTLKIEIVNYDFLNYHVFLDNLEIDNELNYFLWCNLETSQDLIIVTNTTEFTFAGCDVMDYLK